MEATVWVLAEEASSGLTLRKVAERAGKNRGLIHYYFESKDDLLRSLLDHIFASYDRLMDVDEEAPPTDRLWTVLRFFAYGPGGVDEPDRHYHVAIFQLQLPAAHDPELRERFARNVRYTVGLTASNLEDGTFRAVDPAATAVFLVAAIGGARNAGLSLDADFVREPVMESIDRYVAEVLVA